MALYIKREHGQLIVEVYQDVVSIIMYSESGQGNVILEGQEIQDLKDLLDQVEQPEIQNF